MTFISENGSYSESEAPVPPMIPRHSTQRGRRGDFNFDS